MFLGAHSFISSSTFWNTLRVHMAAVWNLLLSQRIFSNLSYRWREREGRWEGVGRRKKGEERKGGRESDRGQAWIQWSHILAGCVKSSCDIDRLAEVHGLFLWSGILHFSMCLVAEWRAKNELFVWGSQQLSSLHPLTQYPPPLNLSSQILNLKTIKLDGKVSETDLWGHIQEPLHSLTGTDIRLRLHPRKLLCLSLTNICSTEADWLQYLILLPSQHIRKLHICLGYKL